MYKFFRVNLNSQEDRNAWYLVVEMFWASMLSSVAVFNAAFAVHLGATNTQVGWMTSLPALLAVLISIPAGRFLQSRRRPKSWIMWALGMHRTGFLLVALMPWVHLFNLPTGALVIAVLVAVSVPATFFNIGFIPMLAEVIPEERRSAVFTARNIIYNASVMVFVFLFGQWLNRVAFPINYQVLYVFGWLTSMISVYFCVKVQVADTPVADTPVADTPVADTPVTDTSVTDSTVSPVGRKKIFSLAAQWRSLRQAFRESPAFRRITINTFLHGFALWLATPLYVLYYVRNLGASDAWLGTQGMIASAVTILGYAFWRWLMGKWGESRTLKSTIVLVGVFPVLVGLFPSLTLILLAVGLNSLIGAGVNLSHFNLLLKSMPADKRSEYTALYMTLMNLGIFIFPMLGVVIANWVGFRPALILFGLTSILGSTSFWWWQVQEKSVDR